MSNRRTDLVRMPSPQPPGAYRHDPYSLVFTTVEAYAQPSEPPVGTCHVALWGEVTFVPYPAEEFSGAPLPEDEPVVRVFLGQLPYQVTDMQVQWLCYTFGFGSAVAYPERIMKRQPNGERLPTGCVHAYATMTAVEAMAEGMHKRMLVDDTGVWHAQTVEEFEVLSRYVSAMKTDKSLRIPNHPYDSVVVQTATSNFYSNTHSHLETAKAQQRWSDCSVAPPPSYEAALGYLPPTYAATVPPPPPYFQEPSG
jgi:hypothetical protein